MSKVSVYVKDLNEELDRLYDELDMCNNYPDNYSSKKHRKWILSRIDKLEGDVNNLLSGTFNNSNNKKNYYDDDEDV